MKESDSACFVTQIDVALAEKLKTDLQEQGFELSFPTHTLVQGKKKGISITLYTSGKLTVQGKSKHEFLTYYLEPQILGALSYSYPLEKISMSPRIGIDEAGKGDFFGPLCIGGLFAHGEEGIKRLIKLGVKDSKRLSDEKICSIAKDLKKEFATSVIRIFPKRYNELYDQFKNLNSLLAWGHSAAIEHLVSKTQCLDVIIDQFASEWVVEKALKKKGLSVQLTQRHKGEEDPVVAAASILARAAFVEGMQELEDEYKLKLPKGVNSFVKEAAKKAISIYGEDFLPNIAKMHFKTSTEVLNNHESS
jgi:ribonuclease HIII